MPDANSNQAAADAAAEKAKKEAKEKAAAAAAKEKDEAKAKADKDAKSSKAPKDVDKLGEQVLGVFTSELASFLKANEADGKALGEDVVKAIFAHQVFATMPAILVLPEGVKISARADLEGLLTERSRVLQLVAKAEREQSQRVERIRGNASSAAVNVAKSVLGLAMGFGIQSLLQLQKK